MKSKKDCDLCKDMCNIIYGFKCRKKKEEIIFRGIKHEVIGHLPNGDIRVYSFDFGTHDIPGKRIKKWKKK